MKKHLITSIIIVILIVSCKQKEAKKTESIEQKSTTELKAEPKNSIEEITIPEQYFENDSLRDLLESELDEIALNPNEEITIPEQYFENDSLRNLLESELDEIALNPKFELTTEPKINTHDQTITDTIKSRTYEQNKIFSYKYQDREWIYSAKIRSSEFKFLDSVKIGIKKQTLKNILKSQLESDLIKIGDLENTSVFFFTFENETLKTIDYEGYVD